MTLEVSSKLNVSVILSILPCRAAHSIPSSSPLLWQQMQPREKCFHFTLPQWPGLWSCWGKKKKSGKKSHFLQEKRRAHWCVLGIRGSGLLVSAVVSPFPQALGAAVWDDQAELPHFSGSELHNLRVC